MIQFQALGALAITSDGEDVEIGGRRQRRLLAMLLIHRNTVVSVDRLADAVFDGEPTPAAATTMRSYVARIRRLVEVDGSTSNVVTRAPGYMLTVPDDLFDVARFERQVTDGRSRLGRDDMGAAAALREALTVWRGDAYAEFTDDDWARPEAQRIAELRIVALEGMFDAELASGQTAELVPRIEALVGEQPLRETPRAQLMLALYRSGRQTDALRQFGDYRTSLVEELGLEPSPALCALEARILAHDPTLVGSAPSGQPLRGYRLGERLGTGRDGTVHAAHLPGVDREYVIRTIRPEVADAPGFVRSFETTAQRVAALEHPAIVRVHDYWREPGAAYVVMPRLHGGTLADRLARGSMTPPQIAALVSRIGGSLVAAADAGVVHGRLSTRNVLFDDNGDACLTDFTLDPEPTSTPAGDVRGFATLLGNVLNGNAGDLDGVDELLSRARSSADQPTMAELVPALVTRVAGLPTDTPGPLVNPYKGLRAFDEVDAADFFGRDDVVEEIVGRLTRDDPTGRLVLVVAGSGTGKSSLMRAGVLPRVRGGAIPGSANWYVTTMLPGRAPFAELAESLRRLAVVDTDGLAADLAGVGGIDRVIRRLIPDDSQLLLVVDQLEELFTLAGESEQRAFVNGVMDALAEPDSRLRVVATLRADFYDRPLAFQRLGAAVRDATVTIAPMTPAELGAAIVEPAARVGRQVEPALVAELVSSVVDAPAALPALQFTLYELAQACDGELTLAAYRTLGGVQRAIASRAEALYRALDDDQRAAARAVFEQLVAVAHDGEPTRRRATRADLAGAPASRAVGDLIDGWTAARLLTSDRDPETRLPTVEVAHEALLREWPRLRAWIDEDRDALIVLGHLRDEAGSWIEFDRDPGALYRGARLEAALEVGARGSEVMSPIMVEFLDASRAVRERELQDDAERLARQARANRRLRVQLVAIATALVIALIGGFVAVDQRRQADHERGVATARELAAAAVANLPQDAELSVLLALRAIDTTQDGKGGVLPEAADALHAAMTTSRKVHNFPGLGGSLGWSPNGKVFVTEGPEDSGMIDIRDAETGASVLAFHGHDVDVNDVAFSPDGSMLATTGDDGALRVWDSSTGDPVGSFEYGGAVWSPAVSPDGSMVAAAWLDLGLVRIFDIASGDEVAEIPAPRVFGTSFSPDGKLIAFGNEAAPVATIADVASGSVVRTVGEGGAGVFDVAFSPDGLLLATAGPDAMVRIWDVATGAKHDTLRAHQSGVNAVDWNADGTRLATASDDGTARVFDVGAGAGREMFAVSDTDTAHGLQSVVFSPDGSQIMTADGAMTAVKVWDASAAGGAEWLDVTAAPASTGAGFVDDGDSIVVSAGTSGAAMWGVANSKLVRDFGDSEPGGDGRNLLAVSRDGNSIATSGRASYPVEAWDPESGAQLFAVPGNEANPVLALAWSPDGQRLAIAEQAATGARIVVVDRSGAVDATLQDRAGVATFAMAFSPDGTQLVANRSTDDGSQTTPIWDIATERVVAELPVMAQAVEFDSTGTRILTASPLSPGLQIWDRATSKQSGTVDGPPGILDIAVDPQGTHVAAANLDGSVRVWDTASWAQAVSLHGPGTFVRTVEFSPDGSRLMSVGDDGIVRVWALDIDDLTRLAEQRLTRTFTADECRRYLHLDACPASAISAP